MTPEQSDTLQWSFCGSCPKCNHVFPPLSEIAADYFEDGAVACETCGAEVDIWSIAASRLGSMTAFSGLTALGATSTVSKFRLARYEVKSLDFKSFGVPSGARILSVNYTPLAVCCFPIEMHGNLATMDRYDGLKVTVYGRPMRSRAEIDGGHPEPCEADISLAVTWIKPQQAEMAWVYMADAFESVAKQKYVNMLVPAQSAVEIRLMTILFEFCARYVSRSSLTSFFERDCTYSGALNVLVPLLCGAFGLPIMPEAIRGQLNRLRRLRNKYVHEGVVVGDIDETAAGELLAGAVFGFEYLSYLAVRLKGGGS